MLDKIIFDTQYKPVNTKYFVVHHFGGLGSDQLASTTHLTADNIDAAHGARFGQDFHSQIVNPSTGRGWRIGYNFIIFPSYVLQARAVGEETAAQKGFNFDGVAVSVCMAGNFSRKPDGSLVNTPNNFQIEALRNLKTFFPQISLENCFPHRRLAQTDCYGSGLTDEWVKETLIATAPVAIKQPETQAVQENQLKVYLSLLAQYLGLLKLWNATKKMGGFGKGSCLDHAK